ncbi:MAG: leucyl/phenylalanyl-tRNA--protein transferase [Gammaproteobacteria bacterium]
MINTRPFWIDPAAPADAFPDVDLALREPDGLLAVGGDLGSERLLAAYRRGIFPWYSEGQPILWWSPDPRTVLFPADLKISRSLRKTLNRRPFELTVDRAFDAVVAACAEPRDDNGGTWITPAMAAAYGRLHREGHAHSIECWREGRLAGGLYGVAIGRVFFGESMFSRETDASKVAFCHLVRQLIAWDFALVDCQVYSTHLSSLGAERIPRGRFVGYLDILCDQPQDNVWRFDAASLNDRWPS